VLLLDNSVKFIGDSLHYGEDALEPLSALTLETVWQTSGNFLSISYPLVSIIVNHLLPEIVYQPFSSLFTHEAGLPASSQVCLPLHVIARPSEGGRGNLTVTLASDGPCSLSIRYLCPLCLNNPLGVIFRGTELVGWC
jgi:hypothetical protein